MEYYVGYIPFLVTFVAASAFGIGSLALASVLRPKFRPGPLRTVPYESGIGPSGVVGDTRGRHGIHFYMVAIVYVVFDLELAFLFPWAVIVGSLGLFGLVEMAIFIAILLVGYIYAWKKGAFDWGL